ncbi:MAG: hypothetical protein ABL888_15780 [Pirellulaceae bacterium]
MKKLHQNDFVKDDYSGKWHAFMSLPSGEIVQISLKSSPDDKLIGLVTYCLTQIDIIKGMVLDSPTPSIRKVVQHAFRATKLPESIDNMKVWSVTIYPDIGQAFTAGVTSSISSETLDPRKTGKLPPTLRFSTRLDASSKEVTIIDVERLSDIED